MKNQIILFMILGISVSVIFSGCTDRGSMGEVQLMTIDGIEDLNVMLNHSPVLILLGANWCPSCVSQKPIVEELAEEYGDRMNFVYIDIDRQQSIARNFNVVYIPDILVIVGSNEGKYIYLNRYGSQTYEMQEAMMVGFTEKKVLEVTVQNALKIKR